MRRSNLVLCNDRREEQPLQHDDKLNYWLKRGQICPSSDMAILSRFLFPAMWKSTLGLSSGVWRMHALVVCCSRWNLVSRFREVARPRETQLFMLELEIARSSNLQSCLKMLLGSTAGSRAFCER
jgi:hypothetical protein